MKPFLKYTVLSISLVTSFCLSAETTTTNPNNTTPNQAQMTLQTILQKQGITTQEATNSLIKWLNANLVNGTPLEFPQSMKGNLQSIFAHRDLNDLNWLLTQKFTLASLAGLNLTETEDQVPTTNMNLDQIKAKVGHFNIGSLLKTTTIAPQSADEKSALILLEFISGLNNQVTALPKKAVNSGMGSIDDFQTRFGTHLAQQSVGLHVLFGLLIERLVKPGLGAQLGGPQKDMSPLALDQYMATRRLNVNDPNGWLGQLANANPAQVAKEHLMLLAEIRYELYLMSQTMEQTNMLLATQQLQASSADADKLQKMKDDVMSASTSTILN